MNRASRFSALVATLAVMAASGCGDARQVTGPAATDAAPAAGKLVVSLIGKEAGGVLLTLHGLGISEPTVLGDGPEMFSRALDSTGTAYRFAIVGDRVGGRLFSFAVPDVDHPESYTVTLVQVADHANSVLESLEGYTLSVQRYEGVSP